MGTSAFTLRHMLVASLLAGLCAGGLPPCLFAAAGCNSTASHQTARVCCCHGKCASHCRMACCQQSDTPQDRTPAPTRPADDSITWGLARATATTIDASPASAFPNVDAQLCDWSEPTGSLLALGIRFNV